MSCCVYVIRSGDKLYAGTTENIEERLRRHNLGQNKSTKYLIGWKLVYLKKFKTRGEARKEEIRIKRSKRKFCYIGA